MTVSIVQSSHTVSWLPFKMASLLESEELNTPGIGGVVSLFGPSLPGTFFSRSSRKAASVPCEAVTSLSQSVFPVDIITYK
jgi:hypothetical protein